MANELYEKLIEKLKEENARLKALLKEAIERFKCIDYDVRCSNCQAIEKLRKELDT